MSEMFSMLAVLTLLTGLLMVGARFIKASENSRKYIHVAMGLSCLSFPWLFHQVSTVIVLAIVSSLLLTALKCGRSELSKVLFCVERRSIGEICFPLGVSLVFVLAKGNALLFVPPVAILALADALSALVGMRFGVNFYRIENGSKTVEGSLTFFCTATAVAMLSLGLLCPTLAVNTIVLMALTVAVAATVLEGMCWGGLDNFFVPVGSFLLLKQVVQESPNQLTVTALSFFGLLASILALKRLSTLQGGPCLAVSGYVFACYMLGGISWFLLPLLLYASYRELLPRRFRNLVSTHSMSGVLSVASVGFWMLLGRGNNFAADGDLYLYPYAVALAIHGSIIASAHVHLDFATGRIALLKFYTVAKSALKSWAVIFVPLIVLTGFSATHLVKFLFAPIWVLLGTLMFVVTTKAEPEFRTSRSRWLKQTAYAGFGSALALFSTL
jgi:phytol kinase